MPHEKSATDYWSQEVRQQHFEIANKLFEVDDIIRPLPGDFPHKAELLGLLSAAAHLTNELGSAESRKDYIRAELMNGLAPLGLSVDDKDKLEAWRGHAREERDQQELRLREAQKAYETLKLSRKVVD